LANVPSDLKPDHYGSTLFAEACKDRFLEGSASSSLTAVTWLSFARRHR
jgi:hypothetical protein